MWANREASASGHLRTLHTGQFPVLYDDGVAWVVTLYSGKKVLNSFGIGPAGINDGSYLRRLSKEELDELVGLLGIPPPEPPPERR